MSPAKTIAVSRLKSVPGKGESASRAKAPRASLQKASQEQSSDHSENEITCHVIKPSNACIRQSPRKVVGTAKKQFPCSHCGKSFSSRQNLLSHDRIRNRIYPFKCDSCEMAFVEYSTLYKHKKIHAEDRERLHCDACESTFLSKLGLKKHRLRFHGLDTVPPCEADRRVSFPIKKDSDHRAKTTKVQQKGNSKVDMNKIGTTSKMSESQINDDVSMKSLAANIDPSQKEYNGQRGRAKETVTQEKLAVKNEAIHPVQSPSSLVMASASSAQSSGSAIPRGRISKRINTHENENKLGEHSSASSSGVMDSTHDENQGRTTIAPSTSKTILSVEVQTKTFAPINGASLVEREIDHLETGPKSRSGDKENYRHANSQIGKRKFKCNVCHEAFTQALLLKTHFETEHLDPKKYCCWRCDKVYANKRALDAHAEKHKPVIFACEFCGKTFAQKICLEGHIRCHTGERPYICEVCDRRFTHYQTRDSHMRMHTREKIYSCETCTFKTSWRSSMSSHLLVHKGEKPFKCKECPMAFTQTSQLKTHVQSVHDPEKRCKVCGIFVKGQKALVSHEAQHRGDLPQKCDFCDKRFLKIFELKRHVKKTHTLPHRCMTCGAAFAYPSLLRDHKLSHTQIREFKCDFRDCKAQFGRISNLNAHKRLHTNSLAFECNLCHKKYGRKMLLQAHVKNFHEAGRVKSAPRKSKYREKLPLPSSSENKPSATNEYNDTIHSAKTKDNASRDRPVPETKFVSENEVNAADKINISSSSSTTILIETPAEKSRSPVASGAESKPESNSTQEVVAKPTLLETNKPSFDLLIATDDDVESESLLVDDICEGSIPGAKAPELPASNFKGEIASSIEEESQPHSVDNVSVDSQKSGMVGSLQEPKPSTSVSTMSEDENTVDSSTTISVPVKNKYNRKRVKETYSFSEVLRQSLSPPQALVPIEIWTTQDSECFTVSRVPDPDEAKDSQPFKDRTSLDSAWPWTSPGIAVVLDDSYDENIQRYTPTSFLEANKEKANETQDAEVISEKDRLPFKTVRFNSKRKMEGSKASSVVSPKKRIVSSSSPKGTSGNYKSVRKTGNSSGTSKRVNSKSQSKADTKLKHSRAKCNTQKGAGLIKKPAPHRKVSRTLSTNTIGSQAKTSKLLRRSSTPTCARSPKTKQLQDKPLSDSKTTSNRKKSMMNSPERRGGAVNTRPVSAMVRHRRPPKTSPSIRKRPSERKKVGTILTPKIRQAAQTKTPRTINCETASKNRKVSRRQAVVLDRKTAHSGKRTKSAVALATRNVGELKPPPVDAAKELWKPTLKRPRIQRVTVTVRELPVLKRSRTRQEVGRKVSKSLPKKQHCKLGCC